MGLNYCRTKATFQSQINLIEFQPVSGVVLPGSDTLVEGEGRLLFPHFCPNFSNFCPNFPKIFHQFSRFLSFPCPTYVLHVLQHHLQQQGWVLVGFLALSLDFSLASSSLRLPSSHAGFIIRIYGNIPLWQLVHTMESS